jgi:hypothetical protein
MIPAFARKLLITPFVAGALASAQTQVDLQHQARGIDFTASSYTKPIRMGSALPATCGVGEAFLLTSAPAGSNVYLCLQANQWTAQSLNTSALTNPNTVPKITAAGILGPSGITDNGSTVAITENLTAPVFEKVVYADQYATIRAAMTALGGAGIVVLPRGNVNLSATLSVGYPDSGITLQGQGVPYGCTPPACANGTVLTWTGAANTPMVTINAAFHFQMRDMLLDGQGTASQGIQLISKGSTTSQDDLYNLIVQNVKGSIVSPVTSAAWNSATDVVTLTLPAYSAVTGVGEIMTVSGVWSGTNGSYPITTYSSSSGSTTVTYSLSSAPGSFTSGGTASVPGRGIEIGAVAIANVSEIRLKNILSTANTRDLYQDGGQTFVWCEHCYFLFAGMTGWNIRNGYALGDHIEFSGNANESLRVGNDGDKVSLTDIDWEDSSYFLVVEDAGIFPIVSIDNLRTLYTGSSPGTIIQWGVSSGSSGAFTLSNSKLSTLYGSAAATIALLQGGGAALYFNDIGNSYMSAPSATGYTYGGSIQRTSIVPGSISTNGFSVFTTNVIQDSGSGATESTTFYNSAASGNTTLKLRAGAGQTGGGQASQNAVQIYANDGVTLEGSCSFHADCQFGAFEAPQGSPAVGMYSSGIISSSSNQVRWSSTSSTPGSPDTGLARAGAGIIEATNGSTGVASLEAASFLSTPAATSQGGTSGSVSCSQSMTGTLKIATCYMNGYAETGAAQTYNYPAAFVTTPVLMEAGGSCRTYNPSTSASVLTLPANASMSAETCSIVIIGQ